MLLVAGAVGLWLRAPGRPARRARRAGQLHGQRRATRVDAVADRLEEQGIITNARVFTWYVERKGELELHARLLHAAAQGRHGQHPRRPARRRPTQTFTNVAFPEGYTVAQMAARLQETVPRLSGEQLRRPRPPPARSARSSSPRASPASRACCSPTPTRSAATRPRRQSSAAWCS